MSAASGASSFRAMAATASAIDAGGRSLSSTTDNRDAATLFITSSERAVSKGRLRADFEIHRAGKSVGDRRPLLDMGHQRVDLAVRDALAFHVDLDPHVGEADRLLADVAGAPDRGDVEVALELQFELVDDPAAMHGIGVQPDREAGAER